MKKFTQLSGFVFMVLLAVSFVTVVNAAPYSYTGDKPIYPAVYQAVVNGNKSNWNESKFTVMDPNTIVIEHVRISDGLKLADFTLRISLENKVVTYQFSDIRTKLPTGKDSDWTRVDKFGQSNREQFFTSHFDKEIPKVMESEALYSKAKEEADKKLGGAPGGGALNYTVALQNPQKYLIYPAVGAAFNSVKESLGAKTADLSDIYCLDNEFIIRNCVGARGSLNYIIYKIKITYQGDQLTINFTDVERIDARMLQIYSSDELETKTRFDTQKITDQLKTQIEKSLATAEAYKAAKKAFFENNSFLYSALSPLTSALMDEFVTKIFKGEEISFSASISDVKKNANAEFKNYATEISASLRPEGSSSSLVHRVTLYTSDGTLARLRSNEKVTLSGKFVRMEYKLATYTFIITK